MTKLLRLLAYSPARLLVFVGAILLAHQLPGWLKGVGWISVLAVAVWTILALRRDSIWAWDTLMPRLSGGWHRLGLWTSRRNLWWKRLTLLLTLLLLATAAVRAWPSWNFMASSSLREDEILNISRYTSRGFAPAVSTYHLARNHIFFNVVNGILPGGGSYAPWRARFVSFSAVLAALVLIVAYSARRGWALAGAACAGLVAVNYFAQKILLEARGYGLIAFFSVVGCIALTEWLRTKSHRWLTVLAVSCVLGSYTLPYYVMFGGALLLIGFAVRPGRDSFLAGFLALVGILLLYAPVAGKVLAVFTSYGEEYSDSLTDDFNDFPAIFRLLQHFVPYEVVRIEALFVVMTVLIVLGFSALGRFARRTDRHAVAAVACAFFLFLIFCLAIGTVPMRVAAFTALPLAFVTTVILGSLLTAKSLLPARPVLLPAFAVGAGLLIWHGQTDEPLLPRQNWRELAQAIDRISTPDVALAGDEKYGRLLDVYLADPRKVSDTAYDSKALAEGKLVAVETYFKDGDQDKRFQRNELPLGVRFVTAPLFINYQRLFFRPPPDRGLASLTLDGQPLPLVLPGDQWPDPALLIRSYTHGDTLAGDFSQTSALPNPAAQPAVFQAVLADRKKSGYVNFLFTHDITGKTFTAEVRDPDGRWRQARDVFVLGELISIGWSGREVTEVRLAINPADTSETAKLPRPPFSLLEAWFIP